MSNPYAPALSTFAMLLSGLSGALDGPGTTDDCTFDQAHQAEVVAAVAGSAPGAVTDAEGFVEWRSASGETTTFGYGGCYDLGSTVTRATPMDGPRSREQVFAVARELAARFWTADVGGAGLAANALVDALGALRFDEETVDGRTLFHVTHDAYSQLYVQHEIVDGVDRVTIAWQGNF